MLTIMHAKHACEFATDLKYHRISQPGLPFCPDDAFYYGLACEKIAISIIHSTNHANRRSMSMLRRCGTMASCSTAIGGCANLCVCVCGGSGPGGRPQSASTATGGVHVCHCYTPSARSLARETFCAHQHNHVACMHIGCGDVAGEGKGGGRSGIVNRRGGAKYSKPENTGKVIKQQHAYSIHLLTVE